MSQIDPTPVLTWQFSPFAVWKVLGGELHVHGGPKVGEEVTLRHGYRLNVVLARQRVEPESRPDACGIPAGGDASEGGSHLIPRRSADRQDDVGTDFCHKVTLRAVARSDVGCTTPNPVSAQVRRVGAVDLGPRPARGAGADHPGSGSRPGTAASARPGPESR